MHVYFCDENKAAATMARDSESDFSESDSESDFFDSDSDSDSWEAIEIPLRFPTVPDSIIAQILSRLPVKSLLEFKRVSKSWHSLISSKFFIKSHLHASSEHPSLARHRFFSTIKRSYWKLEHHSLPSFKPRRDIYSSDVDGEHGKQRALDLVGSCNGVICFHVGKECSFWWNPVTVVKKSFVLWNPATKESKILPDFHGRRVNPIQVYITKYGFGYDEISDDYKVFAVMSVTTRAKMIGATEHETVAKVYSLKSDSWKRIELIEDDAPLDVAGKFAGGKLHWVRNSSLNWRWDIVSFDLTTEAFGHVDQPDNVEPGFYTTLGVLHGSLCVLCDYCKTQLDVWIWNEYGNQDSWTKMVSISFLSDSWTKRTLSNPLCILPNREVLFHHGSGFVSYNARKGWIYHPQIIYSDKLIGAEVYVESLVSLASENAIKSPDVEDGMSKKVEEDGTSKKGKPRKNPRKNSMN